MSQIRYSLPYLIVAALCLVVHNIMLIVADAFGLPLWIIISLSFAVVATFGYIGHSLITFAQRLTWSAFFRYSTAMGANIPIAFGLVWFFRDLCGLPMLLVAPMSSVLMLAVNYCLSRWAILRFGQKRVAS